MEPFFCSATGKKLPGKHGQQHLSAAPKIPGKTANILQNMHFQTWHGFR
jgi:hypothetical protein